MNIKTKTYCFYAYTILMVFAVASATFGFIPKITDESTSPTKVPAITIVAATDEPVGDSTAIQPKNEYKLGFFDGQLAATGKGSDALVWTTGSSLISGCGLGCFIPYPVAMPWVALTYPIAFGGCAGGLTGVILANQGAEVPPILLAGKSEDYRLGFIDGYAQHVHKLRVRKSYLGTAIGSGLATAVIVVLLLRATQNIE